MILSCQSPLKPQLAPENSAILSLWGAQWLLRLCLGPAEGEAFSSVSHSTKTLFPTQHRAHRDPSPHWGGLCHSRESSWVLPFLPGSWQGTHILLPHSSRTHTQPLRPLLCLNKPDQQHLGASQPGLVQQPIADQPGLCPSPSNADGH